MGQEIVGYIGLAFCAYLFFRGGKVEKERESVSKGSGGKKD